MHVRSARDACRPSFYRKKKGKVYVSSDLELPCASSTGFHPEFSSGDLFAVLYRIRARPRSISSRLAPPDSGSVMSRMTSRQAGTTARVVEAMLADKKYMEEEWVTVSALKAQFSGNTDVLTREERLLEFISHLNKKHDTLPMDHISALLKAMVKDGSVEKCRRRHGAVFDQRHAAVLAKIGVDVEQAPAPEG